MKKILLTTLASLSLLMSCNESGEKSTKTKSEKLSGAGATFPAPFYNIVLKKYSETSGSEVTYGAIGSGGGIRSLKDKTVDFGATDVYLTDNELKEMGTDIIHIPTCLGAVVLSYNLPGVTELKLNAVLVSDIFLGKIKNWNDEKIKTLNPGINLPNKTITPVYRSDGSGTTAVFSEYMSKVNPAWKTALGEGKSLKFPTGVSAKGNPGVAGIVVKTEGAIGYIGSEYATSLNISTASLQNRSGNFIKADAKTISVAADVEIPEDTRVKITDSSNPEAYPISTFTWIIVYKEQNYNNRTESKAKSLKNMLNFIISEEGQSIASQTGYAPLMGKALEKTKTAITKLTYKSKSL